MSVSDEIESNRITRGGHIATGTSAVRRAKTATNGTPKSASTRQALVAAGRAVFIRDGYFDARVSDIVTEADVAHGSFYTYFPSKREIFLEVVAQVGSLISTAVQHDSTDVPGDIKGNLERANRRYLRVHRENARLLALVEQAATADPEVQKSRISVRKEHVDRVTRMIVSLQQRGHADTQLDAHTTAGALVSMLSSYSHWSTLDPDFDEDRVVHAMTQIWVRAVGIENG